MGELLQYKEWQNGSWLACILHFSLLNVALCILPKASEISCIHNLKTWMKKRLVWSEILLRKSVFSEFQSPATVHIKSCQTVLCVGMNCSTSQRNLQRPQPTKLNPPHKRLTFSHTQKEMCYFLQQILTKEQNLGCVFQQKKHTTTGQMPHCISYTLHFLFAVCWGSQLSS